MKLASFLIISGALHAAVFVYTNSVRTTGAEHPVPVSILNLVEDGTARVNTNTDKAGDKAKNRSGSQQESQQHNHAVEQQTIEPVRITESKIQPLVKEDISSVSDGLALATADRSETGSPSGPMSTGTGGRSGARVGPGGHGEGPGEFGVSGTGIGSGNGTGLEKSEVVFVQASYGFTSRPEYPYQARKEGREGRVLLRVLVDQEGKSKAVEVDASSGNEALDEAAREAIKRWRFSPARYGDKPVESWVKIPIDFRLTDAKN